MKSINPKIVCIHMMKLMLCIVLFQYTLLDFSVVFGETVTDSTHLTDLERSWLDAHPTIRLAPDPEFQPIEFFDKNGNYNGIGADYVRLITKKLGIKFEIVKCTNWDDVLARMKRREVDVLNAVVKTPEREKYLNFPTPYLKIPSVIIVRKNVTNELTLDSLKGMNVVMVSGYGYVELIHNKHPEMKIELVSDLKAALRKVSFGMADAFVGDLATASFYIESEGITNLKLAGESEPPNISGFGVRSDWPELSRILEKGVALLTEEERKAIFNKWIHLAAEPAVTMRELKKLIVFIVSFIFLVIVGFLFWNRQLKRMVNLKTEDLIKEINERKRTQEALKESEKNFRALADTSPLAIYMSEGVEQKAVYINPTFIKLFGYTIDEVPTAGNWWPLAYPDANCRKQFADEWQTKVEHAIKTRSEIEPMETVVTCKDGSKKSISWGFIALGQQNWACGLDLTERKQAEEKRAALETQLRQIHKMEAVGTLAGGIAHDFNNILAAILGYAEMAMDDTPDHSRAKFQIEQVLKAGNRAKELVKHILSFSRKETQERVPVQIHQIAKDALKFLRASTPTTIEIKQNIDPQCGNILADPTEIHQVLMNLCTNAAQAMDENGGVLEVGLTSVQLSAEDPVKDSNLKPVYYVQFTVNDNGIGINQQNIDKIFDPYFTTKEVGKGSGMGLAVVIGIVKSHDGMITVDSKPGEGTIFKVYFPKIEEQIQEKIEDTSPLPLGNEKILVVDDEVIIADITKQRIESLGYQVTAKTSSKEALELFRSQPDAFDVVITDQTMPGLTGKKLAKKLIEIKPDLPVIICSGYSPKIDAEKANFIGISAFLMKPVDKRELAKTIRKVLDREDYTG